MSAKTWLVAIVGLVAGAGCVITGLRMYYVEAPRTEDHDQLDGYSELFDQLVAWPVVIVGATILCVTLAYVVTRGPDEPPRGGPRGGDRR